MEGVCLGYPSAYLSVSYNLSVFISMMNQVNMENHRTIVVIVYGQYYLGLIHVSELLNA